LQWPHKRLEAIDDRPVRCRPHCTYLNDLHGLGWEAGIVSASRFQVDDEYCGRWIHLVTYVPYIYLCKSVR
jgi:hypothetical protein